MSDAYALVERGIAAIAAGEAADVAGLARRLGCGPHVLDRAFRRCAGIPPRRFLQVIAGERALLHLRDAPVLEAALDSGHSGPGRLHDRLVRLHALSPGEVRRRGAGIEIRHGDAATPLGAATVAWTARGIHRLAFAEDVAGAVAADWPLARLVRDDAGAAALLARVFAPAAGARFAISALGTPFQVAVWRALLRIPAGATTTYAALARAIARPGAARAVGQAVGANPVALLIPCHRVIQASGAIGGYRWNPARKCCLLAGEAGDGGHEVR